MNARIALLLAAAGASACGYRPAAEYAAKNDPAYAFPHSTHVDADVACAQCHGGIAQATKLDATVRHVDLPDHPSKAAACKDCHDTDPKLRVPKRTAPFRLTFDHAAHLARVKDCKACHKELPETGAKEAPAPPMAACTGCHQHQQDFADARCMPCHVDLKGYKPETAFRHGADWLRAHGALARPSAESCAQCHDQTYCVECHSPQTAAARPSIIFPERVDRAFIHRGDYVSRHMVDVESNPASCRRCHGSGFCDACHVQNNLTSFSANPRDPHPAGWSNLGTGGLHRDAARRNIDSCAGCHDQSSPQQTCVGCHKSGSGNNPHPANWSSRHDRGDIAKNSMCRFCHT